MINNFTFITLTYNHEKYIIEHLESIKYQILKYGKEWIINLIVADDCSLDNTVAIIELWIENNKMLFNNYGIIKNKKNIGTCKNFTGLWKAVKTDYVKVLAGDDLYSYNNIFEASLLTENFDLVSGFPIILNAEHLLISNTLYFNMIATSVIYRKNFLNAMRCFSSINTPSLIYRTKIMESEEVKKFINKFFVVEDFPMQIIIAENHPDLKYLLENKCYVYYRRTKNSTYIIKNNKFIDDKKKQYKYLVSRTKSPLKKMLIKNRILCLYIKNPILKMILNLNLYVYIINILFNLPKIVFEKKALSFELSFHEKYYKYIKNKAISFEKEINEYGER